MVRTLIFLLLIKGSSPRARTVVPRAHVDLYLTAKRKFQGKLPSLKQSYLEKHLLGIERSDDVPSRFVPQYYQEFLLGGTGNV